MFSPMILSLQGMTQRPKDGWEISRGVTVLKVQWQWMVWPWLGFWVSNPLSCCQFFSLVSFQQVQFLLVRQSQFPVLAPQIDINLNVQVEEMDEINQGLSLMWNITPQLKRTMAICVLTQKDLWDPHIRIICIVYHLSKNKSKSNVLLYVCVTIRM